MATDEHPRIRADLVVRHWLREMHTTMSVRSACQSSMIVTRTPCGTLADRLQDVPSKRARAHPVWPFSPTNGGLHLFPTAAMMRQHRRMHTRMRAQGSHAARSQHMCTVGLDSNWHHAHMPQRLVTRAVHARQASDSTVHGRNHGSEAHQTCLPQSDEQRSHATRAFPIPPGPGYGLNSFQEQACTVDEGGHPVLMIPILLHRFGPGDDQINFIIPRRNKLPKASPYYF